MVGSGDSEKPSKKAISNQLKYYYRHRAQRLEYQNNRYRNKKNTNKQSSVEDDLKKKILTSMSNNLKTRANMKLRFTHQFTMIYA